MGRKIISSIFIGIVICSFVLGLVSEVAADQQVIFPDKNLEEVIREKIGKSNGTIYVSDLEEITELDASKRNITSIEGLEYCKNLKELYLGDNNISNISPLSNLTNLKGLTLGSNNISDISSLANLTNLEVLFLWNNNISDISPLTNLKNLLWLFLWNNNVSDISPLTNLKNLQWLVLGGNNIYDISPLIENLGINEGDKVDISNNPLNSKSINTYIPELENRGVELTWEPVIETPPMITPAPTTASPTTTSALTTAPPTTAPSHQSNTSLYLGIAAVAIVILGLAIYQITKKKPEKEVTEKIKEEKPIEKPTEKEEISPKLQKLLQEKQEMRGQLEELKKQKEDLIKKGLMSEEYYQHRYDEFMDKLVDIEDKIIQEKMKGGKKK